MMSHLVSFKYPHDFFDADLDVTATVWPEIAATRWEPAEPADFGIEKVTINTTSGDIDFGDLLSDVALEEIAQYFWDNIDVE